MNKNTTINDEDEQVEETTPTPLNDAAADPLRARLINSMRAATPPPPKPPAIALRLLETQAHDFICDVVEAQRLAFSRNQSALKAKTHANGKLTEAADLFEYLNQAGSPEVEKLRQKLLNRLEELNTEFTA